jgi:hypothetical protein
MSTSHYQFKILYPSISSFQILYINIIFNFLSVRIPFSGDFYFITAGDRLFSHAEYIYIYIYIYIYTIYIH